MTKLQKECEDRPNIERGITKQELISAYWTLAKKLGKNPSSVDLDKHGQYRYSYYVPHRWKKFSDFLKEVNIPISEVTKRWYSEKEAVLIFCLIENLMKIKENENDKEINLTILKHLKYKEKSLFNRSIFSNKFGSFDNFVNALNSEEKYKNIRQKLNDVITEFLKNN